MISAASAQGMDLSRLSQVQSLNALAVSAAERFCEWAVATLGWPTSATGAISPSISQLARTLLSMGSQITSLATARKSHHES